MKKTLIALMALASVAMADVVVEYDFTGTSPLAPTVGTGSTLNSVANWSVADGNLTYTGNQDKYSGVYCGNGNVSIFTDTTLTNWEFSITASVTLPSGDDKAGLVQFFGENFSDDFASCALVFGKDGSYGLQFRSGGTTNTMGTVISFTADKDSLAALGVSSVGGTMQEYGVSYINGNIALTIGNIDITSALTSTGTTATLSEFYNSKGFDGLTIKKLGYANEVDVFSVCKDTVIANVTVSTPAIPEPATATLSLLALAGLCARRRRA